MAPDADVHDDDRSPWTQRGFLVAAILVGAIVVIGIVVAATGGGEDAQPEANLPRTPPAQTAPPTSASSNDSACDLPVGDQTVPTTTPDRTEWELVGTMAAPQAPETIGPGTTTRGLATCFAHSPLGALYAAVNFWASGTIQDADRVYSTLAADSEVQRAAIRGARENPGQRVDDRGTLQVAGFRYEDYDSARATLELAFRRADGRMLRLPTVMRWEEGDWRYVIAPNGRSGGSPIADLEGFTAWSGA